ncbi:hypothetical protein [Pedobacter sp. L105]|uniref:hypothetical protein n=1 Tax=Pedobacter sp. L105 TaxID=1641871 RepID=UPI00131A7682|nr:hypothetical protein [Pedobacter sp. L105]
MERALVVERIERLFVSLRGWAGALPRFQRMNTVSPTSLALPLSINNTMLPQALPLTDWKETAERRPGSAGAAI